MKITSWLILALLSTSSPLLFAVEHLKLSTTTSTDGSGLLAVLHPAFEAKHAIKLNVIAVGSGKALKIGANGDVDVVLVHAPEAERHYIAQGHFINRKAVMHNDFVIIGPPHDPAHISQAHTATQALTLLAQTQSDFISRGDDSGTHKKEKTLWKKANIHPTDKGYIQAGQGMGAVLKIADEKQAYTLTDRGTYLAYADKISLQILFEGDDALYNPYHVMAVNPKQHTHVKYELATRYIDFITSTEGQAIIRNFRKKGQPLFYPVAAN